MAKASGPEEFFEVFRQRRGQETRETAEPPRPGSGPLPFGGGHKTVTMRVRTLVIGACSSLLLMVLCLFVGMAIGRPRGPAVENRPLIHQARGTYGRSGGPNNGSVTERTVETPPGKHATPPPMPPVAAQKVWVIVVATYQKGAAAREYADDVMKFLREQDVVKSFRVSVGSSEIGNHRLVYVGPFASNSDPIARQMLTAIKRMKYRNATFSDAYMTEITLRL